MAKIGRPQKPYATSWGEIIPGLARLVDGRWRIVLTGHRFTEADERRAVARAKRILGSLAPDQGIEVKAEAGSTSEALGRLADALANGRNAPEVRIEGGATTIGHVIDAKALWDWLREQLVTRPAWVAERVGIPELASLARFDLPRPSIKLSRLRDLYERTNASTKGAKRDALKVWDEFAKITGAKVLDDLTTEALVKYRDAIRSRLKSPASVLAYFSRVKTIAGYAQTEGEDAAQISAALDRMKVLKAPRDDRTHVPSPIAPADFAELLAKADDAWRARLLLMLNCCLHFDEALDAEWSDFDLAAGTYCTKRNKRGRVIRAATLWPETVAALRAIPRGGSPYVFTSSHGTRFNARGQWKTWEKLRVSAGLPGVQLDDLRDGAYTAACNAPGVDEKFARLLAGHRAHGFMDNYVARNPSVVRPACDAVYAWYF